MHWNGDLAFGEAWVAFRGQHADNRPHAHAALQLVIAAQGDVSVSQEDGTTLTGPGLFIRSGTMHRLLAGQRCTLVLIEPQSRLALHLQRSLPDEPVGAVPPAVQSVLSGTAPLRELLAELRALLADTSGTVDARLHAAVDWLAAQEGGSVAAAADRCGLSAARLRALAGEQLGIPLAKLVLWRKVKAASQALLGGAPLAEAAAAGGFADQAHLTRTMSQVLGITPSMAQAIAS